MFDLLLLMFLLIFVAPFLLPSEREVQEEFRKLVGCDRCAAAQMIVREQQPPVKKKITKPTQVYSAEQRKEFYDKYGFNPEDMGELPYTTPESFNDNRGTREGR